MAPSSGTGKRILTTRMGMGCGDGMVGAKRFVEGGEEQVAQVADTEPPKREFLQ